MGYVSFLKLRNFQKEILKTLAVMIFACFFASGNVYALNLGNNITIDDLRQGSIQGTIGSVGNIGINTGAEDQEVEPGMARSQVWDLEGFFLDGNILSMVGGFDFKNGVESYNGVGNYPDYTSGDIFIDIDGNAQYGENAASTTTNSGYDYVIDIDWGQKSYELYALTDDYETTNVYTLDAVLEDKNNPESNPWRFTPGDNLTSVGNGGFFEFDVCVGDTGFDGGTHYYAKGFDLAGFDFEPGTDFTAHFTMGCGNDNLMGRGQTPVPEPATMLLFGTGLIGLATIGRKKIRKS